MATSTTPSFNCDLLLYFLERDDDDIHFSCPRLSSFIRLPCKSDCEGECLYKRNCKILSLRSVTSSTEKGISCCTVTESGASLGPHNSSLPGTCPNESLINNKNTLKLISLWWAPRRKRFDARPLWTWNRCAPFLALFQDQRQGCEMAPLLVFVASTNYLNGLWVQSLAFSKYNFNNRCDRNLI